MSSSVITFKQFLAEAGGHKTNISVEEAIKLINTHCKQALQNKNPLYRGMKSDDAEAFSIHGEASTRKSANTANYYTVILDHFLPEQGYPKRGQSIILANDEDTPRGYGEVYAIFPYDDVKIGVCHTNDLWFSPRFSIGQRETRIDSWNSLWERFGLSAQSYEKFVQSIKDKMSGDDVTAKDLISIFGTPENIEPALKKAYSAESLDMHLATPKTIEQYNDKERELWIGGKCVAILLRTWEKIQKDDHDNELAPEDD